MSDDNKDKNIKKQKENCETKKTGWGVSMWLYLLLVAIGGFFLGFWVGNSVTLQLGNVMLNNGAISNNYSYISDINNIVTFGDPAAAYGSGEENAVVVRVFSDLQNADTLSFLLDTVAGIEEKNTNVRVEYFDIPKSSNIHAASIAAYARCAVENDVDYLEYIRSVSSSIENFQNETAEPVVNEELLKIAVSLGADEDEINQCVISGNMQDRISENKHVVLENELFENPIFAVGDKAYSGFTNRTVFEKLIADYSLAGE